MDKNNIENIQIDKIFQHPDNPRKNLGDLTELTESIKKKGVMQNLTVIPGHWMTDEECKENKNKEQHERINKGWVADGYTLIIGHRRCAAAKMAGLTEVPCRVVEDMDKKDQVGTMLEENMQRNDLTVWEQAKGFQMMLDLGETEDGIAEKTGFSKTTIKHRLNIAKLDEDLLKEKTDEEGVFQLTLKDLYELERIEDIKTRNRILKDASDSRQLIWKAREAVSEVERKKKTEAIAKLLEDIGIKKAPEKAEKELYTGKWEIVKEYDLDKEAPKQARIQKEEKEEMFYLQHYRTLKVIKKAEKRKDTAADIEIKKREKNRKQIKAIINEMNIKKKEFISQIVFGKLDPVKEEKKMQEAIWKVLVDSSAYLSHSSMRNFITGKLDYECTAEEKDEAERKINEMGLINKMFVMMSYAMEHTGDIFDWQGRFKEEIAMNLKNAYEVLEEYGWTFNEEEKKILDGTHELYEKRVN